MVKENNNMDVNLIKQFAKFCQKKMGIKKLPKITLTENRDRIKTTAGYIRGKEIIIYTKGRHIVDVCRSIAHELKHHKQFEDQEFGLHDKIQDVGGRLEDEANAVAGEMIKQFAYSGHMNIYESRQILHEGRKEDAKRQFPSISSDLIDYISKNDPSGNNKYLIWILKQLRQKQLFTPGLDQKSFINDVITKLGVFNKYLPYIKPNILNSGTLSDKILRGPKDINNYSSIEEIEQINQLIEPIYREKEIDKERQKESEIIYDGDDYMIVYIRTIDDACYYGQNSRWCITSKKNRSFLKEYQKLKYIFFIVNKNENTPEEYKKIALLISKRPDKDRYIDVFLNNDQPTTLNKLIEFDPRLGQVIRIAEMWKENLNELPASKIKYDQPELFALTEYLNDDNLKHYAEVPHDYVPMFVYTDGQINGKYCVGTIDKYKPLVRTIYLEQLENNPKILLRHPENLVKHLKVESLVDLVYNHLGFNDLQLNVDTIKPYYPVPPMKLKTEKINDNNDDLIRLKQLDNDQDTVQKQIGELKRISVNFDIKIKRADKQLEELRSKLGTLRIRSEQLKDDTKRQNDILFKINEYSRVIEFNENERNEYVVNKNIIDDDIKKQEKLLSTWSDEYLGVLNRLDLIYRDKVNYEYSNQQISDAKDKIYQNVAANPMEWINKLKLKPVDILDIISIDSWAIGMFNEWGKNIKSFGEYKLINQIKIDNINYLIFTNEISNTTRK